MRDRVFIDTNIWIYVYASNIRDRHERAQQLIHDSFDRIMVSSQVLGELYHVLTRKCLQSNEIAKETIIETASAFPVLGVGVENVWKAIDINHKYGYSYWDSLIIATAVLNDCRSLYSEDLQHDQLIDGTLRISNPFFKIGQNKQGGY